MVSYLSRGRRHCIRKKGLALVIRGFLRSDLEATVATVALVLLQAILTLFRIVGYHAVLCRRMLKLSSAYHSAVSFHPPTLLNMQSLIINS